MPSLKPYQGRTTPNKDFAMYHSANDTFSIPCNCISDLKCGDEMLQFFIPSASCVCSFCANHLSALYPEESSTGDSPVFGNGQKGQVHSIFIQAGTVKGITPTASSSSFFDNLTGRAMSSVPDLLQNLKCALPPRT